MRDREMRYAGRTDVVCPRESGSVLAATVLAGLLVLATTTSLIARNESQEGARPSDGLVIREALGITLPRRTVSNVISGIPLEAWFSSGRTDIPAAGKSVRFPDGREARWERVVADSEGWFSGEWPAEKFVAVRIERKSPVRMVLEGMGHDIVYVNGTPRAGNPYRQKDTYEPWEPHFDYSRIPLELGEGENLLLFRYSRGRLKIKLDPLTKAISFNPDDTTLPDAVVGTSLDAWGSILLTNGSGAAARGLSLVCAPTGGHPDTFAVGSLPAMGVR
ncbi:MAG: hypothetical protein IT282_18485, partial [Bacteroidetes bacterium]|nr:hypothetical protein [Bacteroidota bacterium]